MKRTLPILGILFVAASAATAQAQPAPPPPGYAPPPGGYEVPGVHEHDGLYVRLYFGLGQTMMEAESADSKISGFGGALGVALGAAVAENLIIYGELLADVASNPTFESGGMTFESRDTSAGVVGIGAGLAYYVMPANLYVSATLAMTQLSLQVDNEEVGESGWGGGVSLMLGKEWWVSDQWGLGVAAQVFGGTNPDSKDGSGPTWTTLAFTVAFSATCN